MSLERKKKELELQRVKLAKMDMEFKIEERLEEIKKLKDHVTLQDEAITRIEEEIRNL